MTTYSPKHPLTYSLVWPQISSNGRTSAVQFDAAGDSVRDRGDRHRRSDDGRGVGSAGGSAASGGALSDGDLDAMLDNPLYESPEELALPVGAGGVVLLLIVGGSLFKVAQLSGGGHVVAESLQGRRSFPTRPMRPRNGC